MGLLDVQLHSQLEGTINETSVLESMLEEKEKELRRFASYLWTE